MEIRNISSDFNVKTFFGNLKIQSDTKSNEKVCGVVQVNAKGQNYYLGFAQFESYEDWNSALLMESSDVLVEKIESFPMR